MGAFEPRHRKVWFEISSSNPNTRHSETDIVLPILDREVPVLVLATSYALIQGLERFMSSAVS